MFTFLMVLYLGPSVIFIEIALFTISLMIAHRMDAMENERCCVVFMHHYLQEKSLR